MHLKSELEYSIPADQAINFGTIPAQYAPSEEIQTTFYYGFYRIGSVIISPSGKIELYVEQLADTGWYRFDCAYIKK